MTFWRRVWQAIVDWLNRDDFSDETEPNPNPDEGLPANPYCGPDLPGTISQHWSFLKKDGDKTWRIRWPTYFSGTIDIWTQERTYTTVNGHMAEFRSFDTDNGARRPSYTMPQSIKVEFPATCILFDEDAKPIAWFKADRHGISGRLPEEGN